MLVSETDQHQGRTTRFVEEAANGTHRVILFVTLSVIKTYAIERNMARFIRSSIVGT